MRRWTLILLVLLTLSFAHSLPCSAAEDAPRRRALLIGCDHFLSQADTYPAAENNVQLLANALREDCRSYALIRTFSSSISSVGQFSDAVRDTFKNAGENDVSLLYISTHGIFDDEKSNADAALMLSDGKEETLLTAKALQSVMDTVPGRKILILDACNAGAFIGKGLSGGADQRLFSGPDYKVLCSAGGSEASWYWQGNDAVSSGASYFATVLADAMGVNGDYSADSNADGRITLFEIYDYICENYAASTPQVYPQRDTDFVIYQYDPCIPQPLNKSVTDIVFDDTLLSAGQSQIAFSFTVRRPAKIYYQLVYHENGAWQFGTAQHYLDAEQPDGTTLPGRKARTLCLDTGAEDYYGYVMLQFITMETDGPVLQGARLFCVQPSAGEISLAANVSPGFVPGLGQEACIQVCHDAPCGLTVNIQDENEKTVRRLAYESPSRPQQLSPAGSTFYWDGKNNRGQLCAPGLYTVQVKTSIGEKTFEIQSLPFALQEQEDHSSAR